MTSEPVPVPVPVPEHPATLEELDRDECFQLLAQIVVGRIAVSQPVGSPVVVPVNFVLDRDTVVCRLDAGATLRELVRSHVSFQADAFDHAHHTGWSVLLQGVAFEVADGEIGDLLLEPWAPGAKDHWVRIVPASVTGRRLRITSAPNPDVRAYL